MFPINLLLAYQLENYQNIRFLKFVYRNIGFRFLGSDRQKLDRTGKTIVILILSSAFFVLLNLVTRYFLGLWIIASMIVLVCLFPIIIIVTNIIISPFDLILKQIIIKKAKNKLKKFPNLKIIGITGSYGKTTTKEYLKTILSKNFNTIATPGTHNTTLGISRFILSELNETTEIMILEMGAYQIGDITKLCEIAKPDVGILTGITFQHLERFGNLDNIIKAKFELPMNLKKGSFFVFDSSNENIDKGIKLYGENISDVIKVPIGNINVSYLPYLEGIKFELEGNTYHSKLLAKHNAINLSFAISVATKLGISIEKIQETVANIDFVPHRMQLIRSPNGVNIIDDSFNGNFEGVKSTLDFLRNTNNTEGKKIYLTPGLVELGEMNEEIHLEIGKLLYSSVDLVLLVSTSATKYIKIGLEKCGFEKDKIKIYKNTKEAHQDLSNILKRGDLIVFQNDWTDNYK